MTCKERLTIQYDGAFVLKGLCTIDRNGKAINCDSCEEVCNNIYDDCEGCPIQKCFDRLGELEDKLENGILIELPYKTGDTVYVLEYEGFAAVDYAGYIFIMANNDFAFLSPIINGESNPVEICNEFYQRSLDYRDNSGIIVPIAEIFTKEEAEARLKELNENG